MNITMVSLGVPEVSLRCPRDVPEVSLKSLPWQPCQLVWFVDR